MLTTTSSYTLPDLTKQTLCFEHTVKLNVILASNSMFIVAFSRSFFSTKPSCNLQVFFPKTGVKSISSKSRRKEGTKH